MRSVSSTVVLSDMREHVFARNAGLLDVLGGVMEDAGSDLASRSTGFHHERAHTERMTEIRDRRPLAHLTTMKPLRVGHRVEQHRGVGIDQASQRSSCGASLSSAAVPAG